MPAPAPPPSHLHPCARPVHAYGFALTPVGFGGIAGGLLSASIAVTPTRSAHKRVLGNGAADAARPAALLNIPEGEFYLIDGKRLRITNNSSARGAGTIGSTANSYVVEAIAAGDKKCSGSCATPTRRSRYPMAAVWPCWPTCSRTTSS